MSIAYSRRLRRSAFALLAACTLLPSAVPAPAHAQTTAAAVAGTEADASAALAGMQGPAGIVQGFPLAPRYYDVEPCYPLASTELALLNRWNADFQTAYAAFQTALNAYSAAWRTNTGAAGRALAAGASPPSVYDTRARQLAARVNTAYTQKAAAIAARTVACPVQGGLGAGPTAWTPTTGTGTRPAPPQQPPKAPQAQPPAPPQPPAKPPADVDPESLGLVSPTYEWGEHPEVPACFASEAERAALIAALEDASSKARANLTAVSGFLAQINSVVESYGEGGVPPRLLGLQAAARRDRNDFADYSDKLFAELQEARGKPICPPQTGGSVGTTGNAPSGTTAPPPPEEETPEKKASRLDAIDKLRTGDANKSGTEVFPPLRRTTGDPSGGARDDAAARMNDAEKDREQGVVGDGAQPTESTPPAANPPPETQPKTEPPPETQPPSETQPPPETQPRTGTSEADGDRGTTRTRPKRPPRPNRTGPADPMETIPPSLEPQSEEDILEDMGEVGPAGEELGYENPLFDSLTVEFNTAVRECDLKKFLEVRQRYIAELQRILSNPHLEARARAHFERILKAVEETAVPIRAPLPCPILR